MSSQSKYNGTGKRSADRVPRLVMRGAMKGEELLTLRPITLKASCEFIKQHHRHNKPPVGHKFSIAVHDAEGKLVGVATAGRPVARHFDDGLTLEVNRTCTDGAKNANSMLYGAVWRAAKAMGYVRCITYLVIRKI